MYPVFAIGGYFSQKQRHGSQQALYEAGPWTTAKVSSIYTLGRGNWRAKVAFTTDIGSKKIDCTDVVVTVGSKGAGLKPGDALRVAPARNGCDGAGTMYDKVAPFYYLIKY